MSPAQEALSISLHGNDLKGKGLFGDPGKSPRVACGAQPGVFPGLALLSIPRFPAEGWQGRAEGRWVGCSEFSLG